MGAIDWKKHTKNLQENRSLGEFFSKKAKVE